MPSRFFRYIESRIDVFAPFDEHETPPTGVWRFMWHHLKVVKGWLAAVMVIELAFSGVEAAIYLMVGWFVDLLSKHSPQTIFHDYGWLLAGAAFVVLVIRPILFFILQVVTNQIVVPSLTKQIRWRNHIYTLGHSLSYFQNDFAGRLSARVIQAGQSIRSAIVAVIGDLWYSLIFTSVTVGFFASMNVWLMVPVIVWLVAYIVLLSLFVPRALKLSEANSLGRSSTTGRIVDTYTNILSVKLFARSDIERSAVRESLSRWNTAFLELMRLILGASLTLQILNSLLIVVTAGLTLQLWSHGDMTAGASAAAITLVCASSAFGLADVSGTRCLRQYRHSAGEHAHYRQAARPRGRSRCVRADCSLWGDRFRKCEFRLRQGQTDIPRSVVDHPARREDRHPRSFRRRQVVTRQSVVASLSHPGRAYSDRRSGYRPRQSR